LGEILFEVLTSPQELRASSAYSYAEHKVVESAPRLQWLANELRKISLGLGFHLAFSNPATQMNLLRAAAEDHQARALVFGNGLFRGYFVIESIEEIHQQMADDGSYFALEARVELREWIPGADFDPLAPPLAANPPLGILNGSVIATEAFDPLQAISASNLLPLSGVTVLSTIGAPAGVTYAAATFLQQGISGVIAQSTQPVPIGNFADVLASTIVRAG